MNPSKSAPALPELSAALAAAADPALPLGDRVDMLVDMAMGLQTRPRTPVHLHAAVTLYEAAIDLCPDDETLARARILARKGTALQATPGPGTTSLEQALACHQAAIAMLAREGEPGELAEAEMNLGLVLQSLAGAGKARIVDAIAAYQRSLRTFDCKAYPVEFAILQNNLATAFLSIPFSDERAKMREALAVQSFEDGLKAVNLIDHPVEYAMLQNNLGNALQYASSSHALENNLRAMDAYDEALKVRTRRTSPLEYANTLANRANCLCNLPDDPERPQSGNPRNLAEAVRGYKEAQELFALHGEAEKAQMLEQALVELEGAADPIEALG